MIAVGCFATVRANRCQSKSMGDTATDGTAENEIVLTLVLLNSTDAILGEHGFISAEEVRSCVVDAVVQVGGGGKA